MRWSAEFLEGLRIAWDAIRANKMRAGLTTLGIIIGIVTVTLMGTALNGIRQSFLQSISMIGTDVLYIERQDWFITSHEQWVKLQKRPQITYAQVRAVERQMTLARAVAPLVRIGGTVKYRNRSATGVPVIGTSDQFQVTSGMAVAQGRFFTTAESDGGRPVCVIGSLTASNLFQGGPAVGNRIKLEGRDLEVVGVLDKQGEFFGDMGLDNQVIIPVKQLTASFWHYPDHTIQVKVRDFDALEDAREEARGLMRKIRRLKPGEEDDFAINQQDQLLKTFNRVTGIIATVGLFITGLSLFVGGIGIMNIMFVSVTERTKEIGIRKAIGAKRRTILVQFLIEAAAVCSIGGFIGLGLAWPLTLALGRFMPASMSLSIVAIAILVSLLTGVIAGFVPAWRASRLSPVDALRSE